MSEQMLMSWGVAKVRRGPKAKPAKAPLRKCAKEGCSANLTRANASGYCGKHWILSPQGKELQANRFCALKADAEKYKDYKTNRIAKLQRLKATDPAKYKEYRVRRQALKKKWKGIDTVEWIPVTKVSFLMIGARSRARKRGFSFAMTVTDLEPLPIVCPVLGIQLNYARSVRADDSASIDRIDPALGYVPGNVRIISWKANRLKNNGTSDELAAVARDSVELARRHGLRVV